MRQIRPKSVFNYESGKVSEGSPNIWAPPARMYTIEIRGSLTRAEKILKGVAKALSSGKIPS